MLNQCVIVGIIINIEPNIITLKVEDNYANGESDIIPIVVVDKFRELPFKEGTLMGVKARVKSENDGASIALLADKITFIEEVSSNA